MKTPPCCLCSVLLAAFSCWVIIRAIDDAGRPVSTPEDVSCTKYLCLITRSHTQRKSHRSCLLGLHFSLRNDLELTLHLHHCHRHYFRDSNPLSGRLIWVVKYSADHSPELDNWKREVSLFTSINISGWHPPALMFSWSSIIDKWLILFSHPSRGVRGTSIASLHVWAEGRSVQLSGSAAEARARQCWLQRQADQTGACRSRPRTSDGDSHQEKLGHSYSRSDQSIYLSLFSQSLWPEDIYIFILFCRQLHLFGETIINETIIVFTIILESK